MTNNNNSIEAFLKNRLGKIGASQLPGLLKEYIYLYKHGDKNINMEIIQDIVEIPDYYNSPYGIKRLLEFNLEQLKLYNYTIENKALQQGKKLEESVKDTFIDEFTKDSDGNANISIIESQVCKTQNYKTFKLIATIDYLIQCDIQCDGVNNQYILECKTTNRELPTEIPIAYKIQVQQQLHLFNLTDAFVCICLVQKNKIIDSVTYQYRYDKNLQHIINWTLDKFHHDIELGLFNKRHNEFKTKGDLVIDKIADDTMIVHNNNISTKIKRLNEIEGYYKEYNDIKTEIKKILDEEKQERKNGFYEDDKCIITYNKTEDHFYTKEDLAKVQVGYIKYKGGNRLIIKNK